MTISVGDVFVCHKMWDNWPERDSRVGDKIVITAVVYDFSTKGYAMVKFLWGTGKYAGVDVCWGPHAIEDYFTKIG